MKIDIIQGEVVVREPRCACGALISPDAVVCDLCHESGHHLYRPHPDGVVCTLTGFKARVCRRCGACSCGEVGGCAGCSFGERP